MELLCNNCKKRINGWKLETWEVKMQKVKDEAVYCEHIWNPDHTLNTVANHFDKDKQILPKENPFSYANYYRCSKCNFISRGNNYGDNYLDDKHEFDKKKNLIHKEVITHREREREQIQSEINNLENKPNRTTEEEQELANKCDKLKQLTNNTQNNNAGLPWGKIGLGVLAISAIILITVLITKKSKKK